MFFSQYTKLDIGIKIGIYIGFIFSIALLYNLIWGNTLFGKQIFMPSAPSYQIIVYQKFQDVRDPENSIFEKYNCMTKYGSNYINLNRIVIFPEMSANEVMEYYYEFLKKYDVFEVVVMDNENQIIRFKNQSNYDIEGGIKLISENPIKIQINIVGR